MAVSTSWISPMVRSFQLCPAVSTAPMMAGPTVAPTPHMQCSQLICRLA